MLQCKYLDLFVVNNFDLLRFSRITYSLIGIWNFDIDFHRVLTASIQETMFAISSTIQGMR